MIHRLPFVESHHGVLLTASRARRNLVVRTSDSSKEFLWERTASGWREAADKVWALAERDAGHQYLDVDGDDVVVESARGSTATRGGSPTGDSLNRLVPLGDL
jgi:hypothetical protein